jgi:hypothetical protein
LQPAAAESAHVKLSCHSRHVNLLEHQREHCDAKYQEQATDCEFRCPLRDATLQPRADLAANQYAGNRVESKFQGTAAEPPSRINCTTSVTDPNATVTTTTATGAAIRMIFIASVKSIVPSR